ncbi:MAG: amylo-alpha-1,6-glucosidase [Nanoarchaeota archaeon]|nr:amylo-alpha-1,6-glucosidase [Nanoarchaeota archaeon]
MKVIHSFSNRTIQKEVSEEPSFLIANKIGGYSWLSSQPSSRYNGVFFNIDHTMYKVIENIKVSDEPVTYLKNNFANIERKKKDIVETFFTPYYFNSLVYELNKKSEVEIILDIRESYSSPDWDRNYHIFEESKKIIIKYSHEGFEAYLVINKTEDYKKTSAWFLQNYPKDQERNSWPNEKFVYSAIKIKTDKLILTFSKSKEDAIKENNFVLKRLKSLKETQKTFFNKILTKDKILKKIKSKELFFTYLSAISSLENLIIAQNNSGIFAGLPWFFQFWTRDQLISLKAATLLGHSELAKSTINNMLDSVQEDGNLPNQLPFSHLKGADSIGWLFKRASELNLKDSKEKLANTLDLLLKNRTNDGFAINNELETWMDTAFEWDNRAGIRIEIQALRLNMYQLMYKLTKDLNYLNLEIELKEKVRAQLWNGMNLADGLDDFTIRPNIFLAAYIYPNLLTNDEWIRCFENTLPSLWVEWGGLTTIGKNQNIFTPHHTGEDNRSYHRGDSWFWVNNLAAIVLHKTDKKRFQHYIEKILQASTKDILYNGAIANASEISSANNLSSKGCIAQAWSSALLIELIHELF